MHIPNRLNAISRRELAAMIMRQPGVTSAYFNDNRPHFMVIEYDPQQINSFEIMHEVNGGYLHAARVS
jgi:hypothetical protein